VDLGGGLEGAYERSEKQEKREGLELEIWQRRKEIGGIFYVLL